MNARVRRSRQSEQLLAARWRENGIAPDCHAVAAFIAGRDILNVPGLATEVKARDRLSLPAAMRQARANAVPGEIPIVVARHNGQGEASMDEWTVTMSLADFENLWRRVRKLPAQGGRDQEEGSQPCSTP